MRCLNSPSILNSLENKIVEGVPVGSRHILIVNAGDGRLGRALQQKLGPDATVSLVTIQPGLRQYVDDFAGAGSEPWEIDWYAARVAAHGAFDYVVFYQLHEYWQGQLHRFQQIVDMAKPGATVWTAFLNAQSQRLISRFLPPVRLGFSSLADPVRLGTNLDFASWLDLSAKLGGSVVELWGMLDRNAQEFCQKQPTQPAQWDVRGVKVSVGTFADAFLWGAAAVGIAFQTAGGDTAPASPKVSFSPYSTNLLQALVLPYPDVQTAEGQLAAASIEMALWRKAPADAVGPMVRILIDQIGGADQSKRVLLVGSGWGRDLLQLKKHYPAWDWVGFERDPEYAAMGNDLVAGAGLTVASAPAGGGLPFGSGEFHIAVSLGHFSGLHEPMARSLAKEMLRVTKGAVYHLEDGRGPEQGLHLTSYSLSAVYSALGAESSVQPVLADGNPTGMYILKVSARA